MLKQVTQLLHSGKAHVVLATMAGNVISYLFNLIAQRLLSVEDFGHATVSINLILIFGLVSLSLTYTITKFCARYLHQNPDRLPGFIHGSRRRVLGIALGIAGLFLLAAPGLTALFRLPASPALTLTLSLSSALLFFLSWQRGVLAGTGAYSLLALSLFLENGLKLVFIFLPLSLLPIHQLFLAIPFGMAVAIACLQLFSPVLRQAAGPVSPALEPVRGYLTFFLATLYTTACIQILLFTDVLFVKARFSALDAGRYATLVLVGKMIYFCVNSIIALLVPEISHLKARALSIRPLLGKALLLGLGLGLTLTIVFSLLPHYSIFLLLSEAKTAPVLHLIPYYGLAATLISLIIMSASSLLLAGYRSFLPLILVFFLLEVFALTVWASSLFQVVASICVISAGLLALILGVTYREQRLRVQKQFALSRT